MTSSSTDTAPPLVASNWRSQGLFFKPLVCLDRTRHGHTRRRTPPSHDQSARVWLRAADIEASDLDLLVDPTPQTTLFGLGGLQMELEQVLGIQVDVRTPSDLLARFRAQVLHEAQPV